MHHYSYITIGQSIRRINQDECACRTSILPQSQYIERLPNFIWYLLIMRAPYHRWNVFPWLRNRVEHIATNLNPNLILIIHRINKQPTTGSTMCRFLCTTNPFCGPYNAITYRREERVIYVCLGPPHFTTESYVLVSNDLSWKKKLGNSSRW